jgi:hypothetical protein
MPIHLGVNEIAKLRFGGLGWSWDTYPASPTAEVKPAHTPGSHDHSFTSRKRWIAIIAAAASKKGSVSAGNKLR